MSEKQPLDPMDEMHDGYNPSENHLFDALDGDVHSQGIKADHRDWLDMGSESWQKLPDEVKAAAYQAATCVGGWEDNRLKSMMMRRYAHLKESIMDMTIKTLKMLAEEHPLLIEQDEKKDIKVTIRRYKNAPTDVANVPQKPL